MSRISSERSLLDNGHYNFNYTVTILQLTSHAATISHALNMSRHGVRCRSTDNVLLIVGFMSNSGSDYKLKDVLSFASLNSDCPLFAR